MDMQQVAESAYHDTPVLEFHRIFGHPVSINPHAVPDIKMRRLRVNLLATELVEFARASGIDLKLDSTLANSEEDCVILRDNPNLPYDSVEAADALGDIRYVTDGANLVYGFPGRAVLTEIHRSNMSKLGEDGKPVYRDDGKVLKGPGYTKPDIAMVLFGKST